MAKKRTTKKALVTSGVSLALSAAMLAGTTLAWFTDSVTTSYNVIQAGDLGIAAEFYYVDRDATPKYILKDGNNKFKVAFTTDPQTFAGAENIFDFAEASDDEIILQNWEPGATGAKLITVTNTKDLAAKVKFQFDVKDGGLEDALWFDLIPLKGDKTNYNVTRRSMSELETYVETAEFALLGTNSPENQIINEVEVGEQATFILVYGMDEAAGNEFKTTKFEARISLQAKQYTYEADDFNNKYDKKATYAPQTKAEFEAIYGEGNVVVISEEVATGLSAEEEAKAIASKFESLVGATQAADSESVAPQVILVDREIDFLTLGEAGKQDVDEDTGKIIIARDVIIEGINSDAVITGRPLKIAENVKNVTIKNITFTKPGVNPQNDNCFIQGYYFKGKLSIEGCTFTDPQHESIRLMGNLEGLDVSIINNTFNASKTVVGSYGQVFRQIHIENNFFKDGHRVGREGYKACEVCPDEVTNVTVRLVGNTFNDVNNILHQSIGLINVNLDQVTVGRNTFTGIKEADSTTEGYAKNLYLCYTGNEQANKDLIHGVRSPLGLENLQSPTLCNILQPRDNSTSSETQE